MSGSSISKAWLWSVECSPLLNLFRWILNHRYPNRKAIVLLEAAELPTAVDELIRKTVKRSKLWANERAEIARELIAHTQDAIEAGRSSDEIASTFGNPKQIAKLMRRSMKRKRPLYWRVYRNMKRATWTMLLLLIVGYGSLAVRFYMGKPAIKRNYIAELNAQNDGYSEDQKAWSVYRSVDIEWQRLTYAAWQRQLEENPNLEEGAYRSTVLFPLYGYEPVHTDYSEAAAMVRLFEPQLVRLREAAYRPVCGMILSDKTERVEVEPGVWVTDPVASSSDPLFQRSLTSVLLPDLGLIRRYAMLLKSDAKLALEEGDWDRVHADISSALAMSRQVDSPGFLINHLVAIAILDEMSGTIESMITENPEAFTREHLIEFSHSLARNREQVAMTLDAETMFFDDILQRAYTDDGHGNGRLTRQGVQILLSEGIVNLDLDNDPMDLVHSLTGPITMIAIEDRLTQYHRQRAITERVFRALRDGPESLSRIIADGTQVELSNGGVLRSPVDLLMPAYGKAVQREFQSHMRTDAALTMLAIELFKREHGRYPEALDELVPQYLPVLPADHFNPGYPIQYLLDGGRYALYSAGTDGDLDGGRDSKPANGERFSLEKRYQYQTVTKEDGTVELVLGEDGKPALVNPDEPDSDWVIIDTRNLPKPSTGE